MTKHYQNKLNIPSREEFHRYTSNLLTERDFCTDFPPYDGLQIAKTQNAIRWTLKNAINGSNCNKYKKGYCNEYN